MDALPNADTRRGGENPSCAGFASCTSPKVQSQETKNSNTGVSSNCAPGGKKQWYVLRATYGRTEKALGYLRAKNIETYLPMHNVIKEINGKRKHISEPMLPNILPPICEQLEIKEPEFYLEMNPAPNAYAFGDTQTAITITSALVDMMSEDELVGVVAHECGHIACRHMLYHTLAQVIANTSGMFETLAKLAVPIHYALMYWQRKSELSCDRAAAYIVGPKATASMLARLAGGPKSITSELNLEELAEQADLYDAFCKNGLWNKTLQTYAVMDQDHPFTSVRVREMLKWTESEDYQNLINGGPFCPHCHTPVDPTWKFCQHCGHKL